MDGVYVSFKVVILGEYLVTNGAAEIDHLQKRDNEKHVYEILVTKLTYTHRNLPWIWGGKIVNLK